MFIRSCKNKLFELAFSKANWLDHPAKFAALHTFTFKLSTVLVRGCVETRVGKHGLQTMPLQRDLPVVRTDKQEKATAKLCDIA